MEYDDIVDARGLECPLPILKAKKALSRLQTGQVLKVLSTDRRSPEDFEAFARQSGNALVGSAHAAPEFTFFLRRK